MCNAAHAGHLISLFHIYVVVYAAATESSVGKLFMAGVIPGHVIRAEFNDRHLYHCSQKDLPAMPRATLKEWLSSGRRKLHGAYY